MFNTRKVRVLNTHAYYTLLGGANMMIRLPVRQPTGSLPEPSMAHLAD